MQISEKKYQEQLRQCIQFTEDHPGKYMYCFEYHRRHRPYKDDLCQDRKINQTEVRLFLKKLSKLTVAEKAKLNAYLNQLL